MRVTGTGLAVIGGGSLLALALWPWLASHQAPESQSAAGPCDLSEQACALQLKEEGAIVWLTPKPVPVEEEIQFHLRLPQGYRLAKGQIEGENMYMGRIPLLVPAQPRQTGQRDPEWTAISYLGSCSEEKMRWRVQLELHAPSGEILQRSFVFSTSR